MPDFQRRVTRRLGSLSVAPERRDEIARELAGFLEDSYEDRLLKGELPRTALHTVLARAGRWADVVRELERVEGVMRRRLKTLWLPGLGVSVATQGLLAAVAWIGVGVQIVWHPPQPPLFFHWPWLLALPLLGAAGAAWSRSEGGDRRERLLVALFPVLAPWLALSPFSLTRLALLDIPASEKLLVGLLGWLNWVIVPAAALLLGSLPLLRTSGPTLSHPEAAQTLRRA